MTVFEMIADERRQLADLVDSLTEAQLCTPSLVPTWTVRDVVAHLLLGMEVSTPRFLWTLIASGGFEKGIDKLTWRMARRPVSELTAKLRAHAEHRFAPPGFGPEIPLTELLVHGLDLRRPLGLAREIPEERRRLALGVLTGPPVTGFVKKGWLDGLRLEASDCDWSHGSGPLLRGHSEALMLAATGRVQALAQLEGEGVALLRARFG